MLYQVWCEEGEPFQTVIWPAVMNPMLHKFNYFHHLKAKLEEVKGKKPGEVLQGPQTSQEVIAMMHDKLQKQEGFTTEIFNYKKDRSPLWIELEVEPIFDDNGKVLYFMGVEADITEKKAIEAKLIDQNQKENIETYLYYTLRLNDYLGLGGLTNTMLYEGCAQRKPWSEALPKIFEAFTEEDLIGHVGSQPEFHARFAEEYSKGLETFQNQMAI